MVLRAAQRLHALAVARRFGRHGAQRAEPTNEMAATSGWLDQRVDRLPRAVDDVQHALGKAGLEEQLGQPHRAQRRPLRRLEDEGVAGHDRDGQHPQRDHHREVERRNARAHPERIPVEVLVDVAAHAAQRATLQQRRRAAAKSTTSMPRRTSPRASSRVLPWWRVTIAASSSKCSSSSALKRNISWTRSMTGVAPAWQRAWAASTAAFTSAGGQGHPIDLLARGGVVDRERLPLRSRPCPANQIPPAPLPCPPGSPPLPCQCSWPHDIVRQYTGLPPHVGEPSRIRILTARRCDPSGRGPQGRL